jgi:hypothetical protein
VQELEQLKASPPSSPVMGRFGLAASSGQGSPTSPGSSGSPSPPNGQQTGQQADMSKIEQKARIFSEDDWGDSSVTMDDEFNAEESVDLTPDSVAEVAFEAIRSLNLDWDSPVSTDESKGGASVFAPADVEKICTLGRGATVNNQKIAQELVLEILGELIQKERCSHTEDPAVAPWRAGRDSKRAGGKVSRHRLGDQFKRPPTDKELVERVTQKIQASLTQAGKIAHIQSPRDLSQTVDAAIVDQILRQENRGKRADLADDGQMQRIMEQQKDEVVFHVSDSILGDAVAEMVVEMNAIEARKIARSRAKREANKRGGRHFR